MSMRALLLALLLAPMGAMAAPPLPALQDLDLSALDPALVLGTAGDVMLLASDEEVDGLFQAVHASARNEHEARTLCALFDPEADRSLAGIQRAALALEPASQQRFIAAAVTIAAGATRGKRHDYDPDAAGQVLRRAAVTAAMLHDGFMVGLAAGGSDEGSRQARCRSFRQAVDVLADFDLRERAAATRYLLFEGMRRYGPEL